MYRRNHDSTMLHCMDNKEAENIIEDMHEGIFGTHSSGHTMAKKILRVGYYWSTMETDSHHHSRTCHKCQIFTYKVHVPPVYLNVLTSPWPFAMWGINMIGKIEPTASVVPQNLPSHILQDLSRMILKWLKIAQGLYSQNTS